MASRHGGPAALDPDDVAHFRAAVADTHPVKYNRVHIEPPPPPPYPQHSIADEAIALRETLHGDLLDLQLEGGDEASFLREGVPRWVLRDLRRGRWARQEKLDLHGMNRAEARHAIVAYLADCQRRGMRCVRIVHGKGLGSRHREPILKKLVLGWLTQRLDVLAYCQARAAEGGAGAVVVLLAAR